MLLQQRTLNVLSNNIANVRTPGFKSERVVSTTFAQELLTRQEQGNTQTIGTGAPIRLVQDVPSNFDSSALEPTERPFDLAINGEGFFNIQAGENVYLTRNGNFDIDEEGFLVLRGAGRVLGQNGEIRIGSAKFQVNQDGTVYDERGRRMDQLMITRPAQDAQLTKFANGMYTLPLESTEPAQAYTIEQGVIENSNIDINREYTLVMEAQRAFQACSQALKVVDEMNGKASSQIASL